MKLDDEPARQFYDEAWLCLNADAPREAPAIEWCGTGTLPSVFATTDLTVASIATAAAAVAELVSNSRGPPPTVAVNRRLASLWFQWSHQPIGWTPAPAWDPIAGDYACSDGFIRLHTNAPHHRAAALRVLGASAEKAVVAKSVSQWRADDLETAVVQAGGCAATMRSLADWQEHPQGRAVRAEPLICQRSSSFPRSWSSKSPHPMMFCSS